MIKPYPKNAKKHPDEQLKKIAASLREFGWRQPIVTDKDDVIIVGHGRWLAYEKYPEGIKEPWIVKASDLTPKQVKAYRLADNKLNESDWDMALALEELKELDSDLRDIVGFDNILIDVDNDKVNELWNGMPEFEAPRDGSYKDLIIHYSVNYDPFNKNRFRMKLESLLSGVGGVNEYGMELYKKGKKVELTGKDIV